MRGPRSVEEILSQIAAEVVYRSRMRGDTSVETDQYVEFAVACLENKMKAFPPPAKFDPSGSDVATSADRWVRYYSDLKLMIPMLANLHLDDLASL